MNKRNDKLGQKRTLDICTTKLGMAFLILHLQLHKILDPAEMGEAIIVPRYFLIFNLTSDRKHQDIGNP